MSEQTPPRFSTPEIAIEILHKEQHLEHGLISNRMTWYVASQSFLLTAFAISGGLGNEFKWLAKWVLPPLGLLISALFFASILAALKTMALLRDEVMSTFEQNPQLPRGIYGIRPPWVRFWGMMPPRAVPVIFGVAWIIAWVKANW
jgi:hypothetical protein